MRTLNQILFACSVSLLAACSSTAPVAEKAAAPAQPGASSTIAKNEIDPKNQVICKERAITGSRFKQKTCMTAKEWETMSHESKRMVDKATRNKIRYTN
ncbi:hypothetical protein [Microbulbifer sp. SAOS-129_SWC]|uniref:hypothetical protein n=1 Tax=Microbulbifer sp. SAOS-129_SWC TaxID=3145235 RepID=UPI0032163B5E